MCPSGAALPREGDQVRFLLLAVQLAGSWPGRGRSLMAASSPSWPGCEQALPRSGDRAGQPRCSQQHIGYLTAPKPLVKAPGLSSASARFHGAH